MKTTSPTAYQIIVLLNLMTLGLVLSLFAPTALASYNISFSPNSFYFFPGENRDYTLKLVNNDHDFNATVTLKSLDTNLFLVNNSQSIEIKIVNWGVGDSFSIPLNISTAESANFSDSADLEVTIDDDDNGTEVHKEYKTVSIVKPTDITYKLSASLSDPSKLDMILLFDDGRNSTEMNENLTRDRFDSWAKILSNEKVIVSNSSDTLSMDLDLIGKIGRADLEYGANWSNGNLSGSAKVDLVYNITINATATYLGEVNYYYPLTEPIKSDTLVCVEGNVTYDGVFPLGYFGEGNEINMTVANNKTDVYSITVGTDGKFVKCFRTNETGNYTITINATGTNNLKAAWTWKFEVSNIKKYEPNENVITPEIGVSFNNNTVMVVNKKGIYLFGKLVLSEEGEFKHFNIFSNNIPVNLGPNGNVSISLNLSENNGTPPGTYPIKGVLETNLGDIPFTINYKVPSESVKNISCIRYWEKSANKTKITLLTENPTNKTASVSIKEEIPKEVVENLSFLQPDETDAQMARNCEDEQCVIDIAKSTKDCGICKTDSCWTACINAYLSSPGNKTFPIIFTKKPIVFKNDPIVGWNITLGPDKSYSIVYTIEKLVNLSEFNQPEVEYSIITGNENQGIEENATNQTQNNTKPLNNTLTVYEGKKDLLGPSITAALVIGISLAIVLYFKLNKKVEKEIEEREKPDKIKQIKQPIKQKTAKTSLEEAKEKPKGKKEISPEDGLSAIGGSIFK